MAFDVYDLLLALPANGEWVSGKGQFQHLLMILLGGGSSLIEETSMPATDEMLVPEWQVRLSHIGQQERAAILQPCDA
ncbi:hypothetical protein [Acidisphaera sp. L21]|uniref:hypothetical protein n=1 Tax=Acidisphaera sp. L21 TaxID=1641851 RepID=UPI00131CD986|nr:hypothetical protein [Acidisphaera sp. L21]